MPYKLMNVQNFLVGVSSWGTQAYGRIANVWPLDGGWEKWAQTEIAAWFSVFYNEVSLMREVPVYTNATMTADFVVNYHVPGVNPRDVLIVELKCETVKTAGTFINQLYHDAGKLMGSGSVRPDLARCRKLIVGLFFSESQYDRIKTAWPGAPIQIWGGGQHKCGAVSIDCSSDF